ncbi:MAG: class I SAM-dependent methyltransferase [Bacteroidales bacterium]|nr:class I SAM-dependent methyltransferase [Bacteroidales bacterium]
MKLLKKIKKGQHLLSSKIDTKRLSNDKENSVSLSLMYDIIQAARKNEWSDEEMQALQTIIDLRSHYSETKDTVSISDYGFGSADDKRTEEQMLEGVVKTSQVSQVYKNASSSKKWGELMFRIIRAYKPLSCFELGTCLGISAAYGALALKLNNNGEFITLEGATELARIADKSLRKFKLDNFSIIEGKFQDNLPSLLKKYNDIDFVFIDGHHEEKATLNYFEMFYTSLNNPAIIIFDDINWSAGMNKAWQKIKNDVRINWTIDFYFRGVCYIDKKKSTKQNYKAWI